MRETSSRQFFITIFSAIEKVPFVHAEWPRPLRLSRNAFELRLIGFFLQNANPFQLEGGPWNHDHVSMHENSNESEPLAPLTYTVADVAALAGVSHKKVYDWVKLGRLKSLPMRHFRFNKAQVHRFLGGGL